MYQLRHYTFSSLRFTERAIQQVELMGVPPSSKQFTLTGISISHFENGKIVEMWREFDRFGMLQQIGLIP